MIVAAAVELIPHLKGAWMPGLQALDAKDKPHVSATNTRQLTGSVYVDKALEREHPNDHRWDYAIGHKPSEKRRERIYWVEVHTAADKELKKVVAKFQWLKSWLKSDGHLLDRFERDFVWVSSGRTSFTQTAPKLKQLAAQGLLYRGRVLRIP